MNIFEVVDKNGKRIRLTDERWNHIKRSSSPHAYMIDYLHNIEESLVGPDKVIRSDFDNTKFNFYKFYKKVNRYLKVIVKYLNGGGFVITAYLVRKIG